MLVLSRKCQEVVVVTEADGLGVLLKVTVLEIDHGKVRLGFEAADNVPIHRLEVWERMRAGAHLGPKPEIDGTAWASNLSRPPS
jgi:carbon storage regulator CsrA